MSRVRHLHPRDLQGLTRLTIEATHGVTNIVESMHRTIARVPLLPEGQTPIPGLVYSSIRGINRLVGTSLDLLLEKIEPMVPPATPTVQREALVAAFNGVLGDHLEATANPLAIHMSFRHKGHALNLQPGLPLPADLKVSDRLLVAVHGSCMNDLQWERRGHSHVRVLADEFGYSPIYLHYNSGRHISTNGREFAGLLETLLRDWPGGVRELVIVGHSMGGLVARSACHQALQMRMAWPATLTKMFFLGSPHGGAPLEKAGNLFERALGISRYSAPLISLGQIRSAGITDLRHGSLLDSDWDTANRFERVFRHRHAVPLPPGIACHVVAAVSGKNPGLHENIVGDGLVPLRSALGLDDDPLRDLGIPRDRQAVFYGVGHLELLDCPEVFDKLRCWLAC